MHQPQRIPALGYLIIKITAAIIHSLADEYNRANKGEQNHILPSCLFATLAILSVDFGSLVGQFST